MITRTEYMANSEKLHAGYYGEIARETGINISKDLLDRCLRSTDEHFNDIPLNVWDSAGLNYAYGLRQALKVRGDMFSTSQVVCAMKQAARDQLEEYKKDPAIEGRYVLGFVDETGNGKKNCEAAITWELYRGRFSMCAEVWQPNKRDILRGGQCVADVAAMFPEDEKAQRMAAIWADWHLNDMKAGSPAQEKFLKENPVKFTYPESHYDAACKALEAAGLHPDQSYIHNGKPYKYGSAWLNEELPADVVKEILSWGGGIDKTRKEA